MAPTPVGQSAGPPRHSTKGQPLGSNCFELHWFSITVGKGGQDIPNESFELILRWLDAFCVRGWFATERGKKDRLSFTFRAPRRPDDRDGGRAPVLTHATKL